MTLPENPSLPKSSAMKTAQTATDLVRTYLREIGRVPLLTHEEEIFYGKQVQRSTHVARHKGRSCYPVRSSTDYRRVGKATKLETAELNEVIADGEIAKRKMVEANLRLVVSVAKKYIKRNVDLLDLIQEGSIGMQRGVEKFDPTKGYRFSTYAYWWIRQAITRAIAEKARTIRLTNSYYRKIK